MWKRTGKLLGNKPRLLAWAASVLTTELRPPTVTISLHIWDLHSIPSGFPVLFHIPFSACVLNHHLTNIITVLSIQALIVVRLADSELSAYTYSYWTAQEKLIGDYYSPLLWLPPIDRPGLCIILYIATYFSIVTVLQRLHFHVTLILILPFHFNIFI